MARRVEREESRHGEGKQGKGLYGKPSQDRGEGLVPWQRVLDKGMREQKCPGTAMGDGRQLAEEGRPG